MRIIRSMTNIFSSCGGPLICCSPQACKVVGIEAASVLNNLVIYFQYALDEYIKSSNNHVKIKFTFHNERFFIELNFKNLLEYFEGVLDEEDLVFCLTKLDANELTHTITVNGAPFYTIMYDECSKEQIEDERINYIDKKKKRNLKP